MCVSFMLLWLICWVCCSIVPGTVVHWGVDSVFFFPLVVAFFFCPPLPSLCCPSPLTYACIPYSRVLVLLVSLSSPPPHSLLSPHHRPPHPLMDQLPPSLAGTPCRTVWRRSIRQSNPESLHSGHSGDRWVTRRGSGFPETSPPVLGRRCASARITDFLKLHFPCIGLKPCTAYDRKVWLSKWCYNYRLDTFFVIFFTNLLFFCFFFHQKVTPEKALVMWTEKNKLVLGFHLFKTQKWPLFLYTGSTFPPLVSQNNLMKLFLSSL